MSSQFLMWTALPNGWSSAKPNTLSLCVYLSPRLTTSGGVDGTVAGFPDFVDWPKTAAKITFAVSIGGGTPFAATPDAKVLESALWTALFKPGTLVHSHQFTDLSTRNIRSYPVGEIHGTLRQTYQGTVRGSGAELPTLDALNLGLEPTKEQIADLRPLASNAEFDLRLETIIQGIFVHRKAVSVRDLQSLTEQERRAVNFYQLRKFHEFNAAGKLDTKTPVPTPTFDFHQVVSSLARFPKLLRPLGLAFDLEIPLAPSMPPQSDVRAVPTGLALKTATQHSGPRTLYRIDAAARTFLPAPSAAVPPAGNAPEIIDGVLQPDPSEYEVIQVDVDGAAIKAANFASNISLMRATGTETIDTPDTAGLPALRTSGFSVARTDRAVRLVQTLQDAKSRNDSLQTDPQASKLFLSSDDVTRGFLIDVHDSTTGAWHSLCGRSGTYDFLDAKLTRRFDDEGLISLNATEPTDGSSTDLRLHESLFHWQGWSLTVPRPGRIVGTDSNPADAGNPAGPDFRLETSFRPRADLPLPRLRFGWSYQFRLRAADLAGNSLPIDAATDAGGNLPPVPVPYLRYDPVAAPFVLARENLQDPVKHPGESFEHLVIRSNYNTPFAGPSERHIAPPRGSQLLAETHGMFDDKKTGKLDPNAYKLIIDTDKSFDKDAIHPEAQLKVPYLPDPLARGAGLFGIDGVLAGTQLPSVSFDGDWPDTLPFRISLVEGTGAPSFDPGPRVLTVPLRKADVTTLRLSCFLNEGDLDLLAAWQMALDNPPASFNPAEFKNLALAGLIWMLTPSRSLTLVHAVQQPLLEPQFQRLTLTRGLGDTFATLADEFPISGKSTFKVELMADWQEPVDDGVNPPTTRPGAGRAFEIKMGVTHTVAVLTGRHEFHDTKYRKVNYQAVATTRFREYFPAAITDNPDNLTRESSKLAVDVLNAAPPSAPGVLYVLPTFAWDDASDAAWKTRTRRGGGLRVYLDRPWYSSGEGELLGVTLWNCAPPRQDASEGITFVPLPGPIPIPIPQLVPLTPQVPDHLAPYVTQWAMDPIFNGPPTPTQTTPYFEHFKNVTETAVDLPLLETAEFTVAVAGHTVAFDSKRNLWYCDIEMDAGDAYYPFIRLALARFQPNSVRGAHLSRVVLADFAQLAPDRAVSISFDGSDPDMLVLAVTGVVPVESAPERASRILVAVQFKSVDAAGREVWFPTSETELPRAQPGGGNARLWTGPVQLPAPRGTKAMRLIIKELERLSADAGDRSDIIAETIAERLVYADTIDI